MYDILNEHLRFPIDRVRLQLGQIESKLRELNRNIGVMGGEMDINDERIEEKRKLKEELKKLKE